MLCCVVVFEHHKLFEFTNESESRFDTVFSVEIYFALIATVVC